MSNPWDRLAEEIRNLRTEVNGNIEGLRTEVRGLGEKLDRVGNTLSRAAASDEADDLAKKVTVAIQSKNNLGQYTVAEGHGLLIRHPGVGNGLYCLMSAAHIIVDHCVPNKLVRLIWSQGGAGAKKEFLVRHICLDERYVRDGSYDIGVAVVEPPPESMTAFMEQPVECSKGNKIGQVVVGHGLIYLKGPILLERIDGSPRAMINAISVPGCSGCPTITHEDAAAGGKGAAALYGFVHGCSKHRHFRANVAEASNHLFADALKPGYPKFRPVLTTDAVHDALMEAEKLDAEQPAFGRHLLTDEGCPIIIQNIADKLQIPFSVSEKFSIDSIMKKLADSAFDQEAALLDFGETLNCVVLKGQTTSSGMVDETNVVRLTKPEIRESIVQYVGLGPQWRKRGLWQQTQQYQYDMPPNENKALDEKQTNILIRYMGTIKKDR